MQSNTPTVAAAEVNLIEQLTALLPNETIGVNGTKVTTTQMVTQLGGHLSTIHKIALLRAELQTLVEQQQAERIAVKVTVAGLETYVISAYGTSSSVYGALGFVARKHTAPSAEVKAAAVDKRLATRKKRFTMGKRQRAAIPPATLPPIGPRASGLGPRVGTSAPEPVVGGPPPDPHRGATADVAGGSRDANSASTTSGSR
jgi:hypothetical protein